MLDDQAIFIETRKGLVALPGCAHSGAVNTLSYITKLNDQNNIYAVIGGMHLLNASTERIKHTIEVFKQYNVQKIGLAHCTGSEAVKEFKAAFPNQCFVCPVGKQIKL